MIFLGASRYNIKSIEAVKKAGYFVIVLDGNAQSPGLAIADLGINIDFSDRDAVLKVASENKVSGIIPFNDTGVPVSAYISTCLGLPGITEEVAFLSSDKKAMRKIWMEKGIPCPGVATATSRDEFDQAIDRIGLPCIFKPAHGLGGASKGVIVVREKSEIEDAIEFSQKFYEDKETLIETFVEAELEHSAEVLVHKGKVYVIAVSDKIKTPLPYRVDKNVLYPTVITGEQLKKLKQTIIDAVQALGINNGAAHVELATTKNGFVLFELGARCGGGGTPEPIVHYTTGVDMIVELTRILSGDEPDNLLPFRNRAANYHFLTLSPGRIVSISGTEDILHIDGVLDFDFFKQPGDEIPLVTVGTDRSGFIIIGGDNRDDVYKLGQEIEESIIIKMDDK